MLLQCSYPPMIAQNLTLGPEVSCINFSQGFLFGGRMRFSWTVNYLRCTGREDMSHDFRVHVLCTGSMSGKFVFHYICLTRGRDNCVQWLDWSVTLQNKVRTCEVRGTCYILLTFWDEALNTSLSVFEAYWMWFQAKKLYSRLIFVKKNSEQSHSSLIFWWSWLTDLCRRHRMKV